MRWDTVRNKVNVKLQLYYRQLYYKRKGAWRSGGQSLEETRGLHFRQGPEGIFKQGPFMPVHTLRWNMKKKGYVVCSSLFRGEC